MMKYIIERSKKNVNSASKQNWKSGMLTENQTEGIGFGKKSRKYEGKKSRKCEGKKSGKYVEKRIRGKEIGKVRGIW